MEQPIEPLLCGSKQFSRCFGRKRKIQRIMKQTHFPSQIDSSI